jgi:hypothetical protein
MVWRRSKQRAQAVETAPALPTSDQDRPEAVVDGGLLGDDALAGESADRLGRAAFARRMVDLIGGVAGQTPSAVVGLIGAWGSGKTSVLHLVRTDLAQDDDWSVVDFNPWVVSDVAGLTREFIATVASALPPKSSARKHLARYASRIAPFTSLASLVGMDPSKAVEATAAWLSGDTSLDGERRQLEAALRESPRRILVLIDDVDRLQGDELAALLKLVRLVGRLPNVFYVLAYDETTLLDVLGTTDIAKDRPGRALSYLDKIVQLRLDLPPAPQILLDRMVDESLERILVSNSHELSTADAERLGLAYHTHLRKVLVEPRHIKRYFGQIEAVYPLVGSEVDFVDFALITFVRTFYPEVYRLLRGSEAELTGTELLLADRPTPEQRIKRWHTRLTSAEIGLSDEAVDNVLGLLAQLFPPLSRLGGRRDAETKRIGSSEYFGRYLYLSVPPDDVSDAEVQAALDEVNSGTIGERAEGLLAKLNVAAEPIVDKLRRSPTLGPSGARATLPYAARVLAETPEVGLLGRARFVPSMWISELLDTADLAHPSEVLDEMLAAVDVREVTRAFLRVRKDRIERGVALTPEQNAFGALLADRTKAELEARAAQPPGAADATFGLMLDWSEFVDDAVVRTWVRAQVDSGGPWTPSEFIGIFGGVNISGTARWAGDVYIDDLERFAGIDFVLDRFTPQRDHTINWHERAEATWEERRRRVHDVLARKDEEQGRTPPPPTA